jgi:succinyl-diaminopimelate desuccinylase
MKCAVAAYLQLIRDLNGKLHEYDLGVMITTDEELGGDNGTRALVEDEGYKAGVAIMPDAGDSPDGWKLELSAKGMLRLLVKTPGKNAHGSRPWQGDNAIDKLIALIGEIRELFKDQGPDTNSLTVSIINGGKPDNDNLVPDHAEASLDIRTLTDSEADRLLSKINQLSSKYNAEVTVKVYGNAHRTDKTHPKVAELINCWRQIVPDGKLTEADNTGNSDARFFAKVGVPCIVISPPGNGYHMDHEWVSKNGLDDLLGLLRLYTERVAKLPGKRQGEESNS